MNKNELRNTILSQIQRVKSKALVIIKSTIPIG